MKEEKSKTPEGAAEKKYNVCEVVSAKVVNGEVYVRFSYAPRYTKIKVT